MRKRHDIYKEAISLGYIGDTSWPSGSARFWEEQIERLTGITHTPESTVPMNVEIPIARDIRGVRFDLFQDDNVDFLTIPMVKDRVRFLVDSWYYGLAEIPDYIKLVITRHDDECGFSTRFQSMDKSIRDLDKLIDDFFRRYSGPRLIGMEYYSMRYLDIHYMKGSRGAIRGASRSIAIKNSKWFQLPLKTRKNCLFSSIYTGLNWRSNKNYLLDAKNVIRNTWKWLERSPLPKHIKEDPDWQYLPQVSQILKVNIRTFDNVYSHTATYVGNQSTNRYIDIVIASEHAEPLVSYREIEKVHGRKFVKELKELTKYLANPKGVPDTGHVIPEKSAATIRNDKIYAWDIETVTIGNPKALKTYLTGFWDFNHKDGSQFVSWFSNLTDNKSPLRDMMSYIRDNMSRLCGGTFYAHNGGKFDLVILMKETNFLDDLGLTIITSSAVEIDSRWINISIRDDHGNIVHFKDSYAILPGSLAKLAKDFYIPNATNKKSGFPIPSCKDIIPDIGSAVDVKPKHLTINQHVANIKKYHREDVLILQNILELFSDIIWSKFQLNIADTMTAAGLSKNIFFSKYYDSNNHPIYQLDQETDSFIRASYGGGRTEAFHIGTIDQPVSYLDFSSMYPAQRKHPMPYGRPVRIDPSKILVDNKLRIGYRHVAFLKVLVRTKDDQHHRVPIHGIKSSGRYIFPIFKTWTETHLTSPEIKAGLASGIYEYKIISGYLFKAKPFLREMFEDLYDLKTNAKIHNQKAMYQVYKIIINSSYGHFGYNRFDRDNVRIVGHKSKSYLTDLTRGELYGFGTMGKYLSIRSTKSNNCKSNVAIASVITSYARIHLWELLNDISLSSGKLLYCDTDSVISTLNIFKEAELWHKWKTKRPDNLPELGALENELPGEQLFDRAHIGGAKVYALEKADTSPIVKLKGFFKTFRSATVSDIKKIISGETISQTYETLQINRNSYIAESIAWSHKIIHTTKSFSLGYTKGKILKDGTIRPLLIGTEASVPNLRAN